MKSNILNNPGKIVSLIILAGMVLTGIYFVMDFPPRVEAVEQDVTDLKKIIDYYYRTEQKQVQQQQYYPPPKYNYPQQRQQQPYYDDYYEDDYYYDNGGQF